MPGKSPFRIELSEDERRALTTVAARYSSSYRDVVRAKVVLYAAQGLSNEEIAARVDLSPPDREQVAQALLRATPGGTEGGPPAR